MDIRVLVVGCGFMGSLHARTVEAVIGSHLCGVVDRDTETATRLGNELGVPAFSDLGAAVSATRPRAAIVATPDDAHLPAASTLIAAGVDLMVEKPLATSVSEAEELVALAESAGVRLFTGHIGRFIPRYAMVAEAVRSGAHGTPLSVTVATYGLISIGTRVRSTTNPLWHFSIHDIDAMQWATGGVVEVVESARLREWPTGQSQFTAVGRLSNGVDFDLTAGWVYPGSRPPGRTFTVHCERASIESVWGDDGLRITTEAGVEVPDCFTWPTFQGAIQGALRAQDQHFVHALAVGAEFVISPAEALDAVRSAALLEAAVAA